MISLPSFITQDSHSLVKWFLNLLSSKIIINKYHILSLLLLLFSYEVMSDSETPGTVVCQAPLSMGFPRQGYWSGLPFPSPRGSSWPRDRTCVSCIGRWVFFFFLTTEPPPPCRFSRVRLCATPWTAAYQASLSMGFSRQEHWSGLPFPSPPLSHSELQTWKSSLDNYSLTWPWLWNQTVLSKTLW